ncbi:MAG: S49 family peptidase [Planctomycetes bacterium]|nr:S49 family peptidase [Planctomycetota bacterium]
MKTLEFDDIWAIMPNRLDRLAGLIGGHLSGADLSDELQALDARHGRQKRVSGSVAILPLRGVMTPREQFYGGTSTDSFGRWFEQAIADPEVGAVVFDVDSPGGSVYGLSELTDKIRSARGVKPIIAVSNKLTASAAFHVASAADTLVIAPSGEMGCVGTVSMHVDYSKALEADGVAVTYIHAGKHKVEGNPHQPLTDEAREFTQKRVDEYYDSFVGHLAKNRGVTRATVLKDFGQGRVFGAAEAVERGMADRVATLEQVLSELGAVGSGKSSPAMSLSLRHMKMKSQDQQSRMQECPPR